MSANILKINILTGQLAQLSSAHASGAEGLGFDSLPGQIGTVSPAVRRRCDVWH